MAELHYLKGMALADMRPLESTTEQALKAFDQGIALLSRDDGNLWGHLQMARARLLGGGNRPGHRAEDVEDALAACRESLTVFTRQEHPLQYGLAKLLGGHLMGSRIHGPKRVNVECAIDDFRAATEVLDPKDHLLPWVDAQLSLATALAERPGFDRASNVEEAITLAKSTLAVLDRASEPLEWAHAKRVLGNAFATRSEGDPAKNLERSIEHLEAALEELESDKEPGLRSMVLDHLAASYLERIKGPIPDNVEHAIVLLEEALDLCKLQGDSTSLGKLYMSLGNAYIARRRGTPRQNFKMASKAFQQASQCMRPEDDPHLWAVLQENIAHAYIDSSQGSSDEQLERAITGFEQALETINPLDDPRSWVLIQAGLAKAYTRLPKSLPTPEGFAENLKKAVEAYDAALTRASEETAPWQWANLHKDRAIAYESLRLMAQQFGLESFMEGMDAEARASLQKALRVLTLDRAPRQHLRASLYMGMIHLRGKNWQDAEDAFVSVLRAADLLVGGIEIHEMEAQETLQALGGLAANIPVPSLMLGNPEQALALWESSRARLLTKALQLKIFPLAPRDRQDLERSQQKLRRVEQQLQDAGEPENRQSLLQEAMRLRDYMKEIVEPHRPQEIATIQAITALVGECVEDGSVIVAPILSETACSIFVGLKHEGQAEIRSIELDQSEERARQLRDILKRWFAAEQNRTHSTEWEELLQALGVELWRLFVGRLVEYLNTSRVPEGSKLVLLPHGGLGLLPIGLAQHPHENGTLADRYDLSFAPSLTALVRAKERAASQWKPETATIIEFDSRRNLKASKPEATLVQSWFSTFVPATSLESISAEQVLEFLKDTDLWHFAAHGKFEQSDPAFSGIELASGRLAVSDLLQAQGLGIPRLAVLSACSSGIHDTHHVPLEFTGLPAGFLQAGAAGVIATLWPVYDIPTMLCIGRFYDFLLGENLQPASALRKAQSWLKSVSRGGIREKLLSWRAEGRLDEEQFDLLFNHFDVKQRDDDEIPFVHPQFWAAFVHYGA